jgi:hypothetical protein
MNNGFIPPFYQAAGLLSNGADRTTDGVRATPHWIPLYRLDGTL